MLRFITYYNEYYGEKISKKKINRINYLKLRYNRVINGNYISLHNVNGKIKEHV